MDKISIIIPAFDEERAIGRVITQVREVMDAYGQAYEILVIDDCSSDQTAAAARAAGAVVLCHSYNLGNGAAIKTGIRRASGDVILMMDADGQHSPREIPSLLDQIDRYGMVVGARTQASETEWHRDLANTLYNWFASYICTRRIRDLTSGFRAIHTSLARQYLYLLPNKFSYPTTLTMAVLRSGHCVRYVPIQAAKRVGKSKIRLFKDGIRFLLIILKIATLFSPLKVFVPVSVGLGGLGVLWYLWTLVTYGPKMPPASVIAILSGVVVFMMGLIAEQITQLRFEPSESPSLTIFESQDLALLPSSATPQSARQKVAQDGERPAAATDLAKLDSARASARS